MKLDILYKDKDILVVRKPAFVASQEERGSGIDMVSAIKNYYATNENTKAEVYVIHRLDKPVEGIMVYGLSKMLRLSYQRLWHKEILTNIIMQY